MPEKFWCSFLAEPSLLAQTVGPNQADDHIPSMNSVRTHPDTQVGLNKCLLSQQTLNENKQ